VVFLATSMPHSPGKMERLISSRAPCGVSCTYDICLTNLPLDTYNYNNYYYSSPYNNSYGGYYLHLQTASASLESSLRHL